jgi:GNAT superfamily N-acetyltransferase
MIANMTLKIRPGHTLGHSGYGLWKQDTAVMMEIFRTIWPSRGAFFAPTAGVLIAESNGIAVGFVDAMRHEESHTIGLEIYIRPDFQGRKIGKILFDQVVHRMENRHVETTIYESHHRSIRFFEERNFVEKERHYELEMDISRVLEMNLEVKLDQIKTLGYEIFNFDHLFRIPGSESQFSVLVSERLNEVILANKNVEPILETPSDVDVDDFMTGADKAFVAVKDSEFAGIGIFLDVGKPKCFWKFYGSSRDHAAHSDEINLALFAHACRYARSKGVNKIEMSIGAFDQQGMTLLRHFCKELPPAWITYMRPKQAV